MDTPGPLAEHVPDCEDRLDYGWPVKVLRGKHAGKTGKVAGVLHMYVRILEDFTDIEVSNAMHSRGLV